MMIFFALICMVCVALGCAFATNRSERVSARADGEPTIGLSGIQMRGFVNSWYYYLVLQSDSYSGKTGTDTIEGATDKATYGYDKIKFYTSADDTTGIALSELNLQHVGVNAHDWGVNGLFINFAEYDSAYGGHQVYKVTIEKGCKLPSGDGNVFVVDDTYTYVNNDFGNEEKKLGAFNWTLQTNNLGTAHVNGVQVRSGGGTENFIAVLSDVYATTPTGKIDIARLNTRSKIKIYTSASDTEGKLLSDNNFIGGWYEYDRFGQKGLLMAYNTPSDYGTYNGSTVYKIVVEEGCQLPYGSTSYYTVAETVTYYNLEHGKDTAINGAFRWSNTPVEYKDETVAVTGVQVRGLGDHETDSGTKDYNFIVLQNAMYEFGIENNAAVEHDLGVAEINSYINTLQKVKIYKSATDEEGIALSEIGSAGWWTENKFASGGLAIEVPADKFKEYNGKTIYKIVIEEGCQLPFRAKGSSTTDVYSVYTTNETVTYYNLEYGKDDATSGAFKWSEIDYIDELVDVTGVQVRSLGTYEDENSNIKDYNFIVLKNDMYGFGVKKVKQVINGEEKEIEEAIEHNLGVAEINTYLNTLKKVRIYTSATDEEGVAIAEICSPGWWTENKFACGGLAIEIPADKYKLYNGKTIYKIVVEAGCQLPFRAEDAAETDTYSVYATEKAVTYINADYGMDIAKDYAANWCDESIELKNFGEAEVTTIHNRAYQQEIGTARFLGLFFKQEFEMSKDCAFYMHKLNMLDKIKVYLSENDTEGTLLRDIYRMSVTTQGFGESDALCINIDPSEADDSTEDNPKYKYDGPHMYCVEIMEGCQFPLTKNGKYGYATTTVTKKFYNREYGMTGPIGPGETDQDGTPRTYEAWSIVWAQKVTVTFNVVGIEGLTFASKTLLGGSEIDLEDYQQEGYRLMATDSDGNEAFEIYTLPDHDVTLTLTYVKKGGNESVVDSKDSQGTSSGGSSGGCFGTIGSGAGLLALLVLSVSGIMIKRRKND